MGIALYQKQEIKTSENTLVTSAIASSCSNHCESKTIVVKLDNHAATPLLMMVYYKILTLGLKSSLGIFETSDGFVVKAISSADKIVRWTKSPLIM